jgi:hypothetical protein
MKNVILTLGFIIAASLIIEGQPDYITLTKSTVTVNGTSNVHEWQSNAKNLSVAGNLAVEDGELTGIKSFKIVFPVKGIKSDKGSIMDDKTWEALKAKSCPNITYSMTKLNSITKSGSSYNLSTGGNLTIAGVTKYVTINATAKPLGGGQFQFTGNEKLKMTTYGIDPPTAMFGAMTTGDDIDIRFNIVLQESAAQ